MQITTTVKQLLIINVIFFAGTMFIGNPEIAYDYLALHYPESPQFQIWQIITHMFMHGGIMHIAFNMFALYSFGSALEHFWGSGKFIFFYISCGLGAALMHEGVNYFLFHNGLDTLISAGFQKADIYALLGEGKIDNRWNEVLGAGGVDSFASAFVTPVVGASGAIYGLLVAFAYMFPNAELALLFIPVPIKAKYFVPGILAIDLFLGIGGNSIFGGGGGIAHFAHIGGAIVGFLMMYFWKKNQFDGHRLN